MELFGKSLMGVGALLFLVGFLFYFFHRVPGLDRLGNLPGDIRIERENFKLYFPIATSILVSLVLSLLLYLFNRR